MRESYFHSDPIGMIQLLRAGGHDLLFRLPLLQKSVQVDATSFNEKNHVVVDNSFPSRSGR